MWDGENGPAPQSSATMKGRKFANVSHLYFVAEGLKVAGKPHPHRRLVDCEQRRQVELK